MQIIRKRGCHFMKYKPSRNQITWGLTAFVTVSLCILIAWIFDHSSVIGSAMQSMMGSLAPVLYGIVIAFFLNPILNLLERKWLIPHYQKKNINVYEPGNEKCKSRMRIISVAISVILLIAVLAAMIVIVVPQLVNSIQTIVSNISSYIENVNSFFEDLSKDDPEMQEQIMGVLASAESALETWYENNIAANMSEIISTVTSTVVSFGKFVWNFIIGIIVSIYLLYTKDTLRGQAKKIVYALCRERVANEIIGAFRYVDITFIGFLTGKLLDSLIIGILSFIVTSIIGTPFNILMSFIVGITNIVPFFGPWIGAVIGSVIIFMISPIDCLWFIIMCLAIQIFDGYILGPKILGDSTGLSTFWVIFAIMFFGGVWGFVGWVVGVPLFACIYEFTRRIINHLLRKHKGREIRSEDLQKTAYYENGQEHLLGAEDSVKYYANRTRSNAWTKVFNFSSRGSGKAQANGAEEESKGAGEE